MRKNKTIVVEGVHIDAYAAEGKSLARQEGKVIFVEGVVPGDVVDVRLTKNKKDWAEGHALQFRQLSPDRVEPFCQHFGVCGGCQWQMLPYEKQLAFKQQQVQDVLQRIGKIPLPQLLPIAGAPETRFYRNKLEYTFSTKEYTPQKPDGPLEATAPRGVAGFHAKGFFDKVVQIEKCWLQSEPTNAIRN
ncbi:MAG TPA: TRAM domain-containing protein, partial [Chitinophagaceae bacterium]|nr:TRAM domain-containing protein [Chitinophagaceae bacterium]